MKKLILAIIALSIISLAFQSSPYARRIYPLSSTPGSCQENEIMYNMTSHSLFICTNTGYVALATGASGSFAPSDASYVTKTTNATLTGEFALGTLSTGILKVTTTTGDLSIAAAGTDYESPLTFNSPLSRSVNTISCATCALTSGNLSQFASTTSAQLAGVLSDESGSGVFLNATLASLTSNDVLTWNGSNWINQAASGGSVGSGNVNMTLANQSPTGTTTNKLVKITGAPSTAIISGTADTDQVVGVCTAGCGTTGSATIAILGQVQCVFDGSTTAGNFVVNSDATAGNCEDVGSAFPTDRAAIGRVLSTNVGAGTYSMELMTPDIAFQNAGNGKSKPGGSNTHVQFNDSGVFGGGSILTWNKTTQVFNLGGSGAADSSIVINRNTCCAALTLRGFNGFASTVESNTELDVMGTDVYIYTSGSQRWRFAATTGHFLPSGSNGGFDIGASGSNIRDLYTARSHIFTNTAAATASEPFINHVRSWNNGAVTFQNFISNITDTASAAASTLIDLQVGSATKFNVRKDGLTTGQAFGTLTNCSDGAGAAACGSASAGSFVIDATTTSTVVSTTAVTANSQIFVQYDSSLGAKLSVTCNTTPAIPSVTARTAGTSFTVTVSVGPVTDPACYSYLIVN